jgi:hypothetical protein
MLTDFIAASSYGRTIIQFTFNCVRDQSRSGRERIALVCVHSDVEYKFPAIGIHIKRCTDTSPISLGNYKHHFFFKQVVTMSKSDMECDKNAFSAFLVFWVHPRPASMLTGTHNLSATHTHTHTHTWAVKLSAQVTLPLYTSPVLSLTPSHIYCSKGPSPLLYFGNRKTYRCYPY